MYSSIEDAEAALVFESGNTGLNKLPQDGVFWDVTPCGSCKNRRFGGT
jgi:hypothetical protein